MAKEEDDDNTSGVNYSTLLYNDYDAILVEWLVKLADKMESSVLTAKDEAIKEARTQDRTRHQYRHQFQSNVYCLSFSLCDDATRLTHLLSIIEKRRWVTQRRHYVAVSQGKQEIQDSNTLFQFVTLHLHEEMA